MLVGFGLGSGALSEAGGDEGAAGSVLSAGFGAVLASDGDGLVARAVAGGVGCVVVERGPKARYAPPTASAETNVVVMRTAGIRERACGSSGSTRARRGFVLMARS
ncbi:hypothetical protein GCM10028820_29640 [Tessaracoccus terricola]